MCEIFWTIKYRTNLLFLTNFLLTNLRISKNLVQEKNSIFLFRIIIQIINNIKIQILTQRKIASSRAKIYLIEISKTKILLFTIIKQIIFM